MLKKISQILGLIVNKRERNLRGTEKLHLGCGNHIIAGWGNIDIDPAPGGIKLDLCKPLPIADNSIRYIFTEHFIEHISLSDAENLLKECYRVLMPEGIIRISTPDLRKLIDEYLKSNTAEWSDVGWTPKTPCQMVNEGMRSWGHIFIFDQAELVELLKKANFQKIEPVEWHTSKHSPLKNLEKRPYHGEIILEAQKT